MEVAPVTTEIVLSPVNPVTPVSKIAGARKSAPRDEPDKIIPEPEPGTGEHVDIYV
jgi:hypothetical protein